jgi:hypothetical protein
MYKRRLAGIIVGSDFQIISVDNAKIIHILILQTIYERSIYGRV